MGWFTRRQCHRLPQMYSDMVPFRHRPPSRQLEGLDALWWDCENVANGMPPVAAMGKIQHLLQLLSRSYPQGQVDGLDEWLG